MTTDSMRRTTQNTAGNSKNRSSQFSSRHRPLTLRNLLCFCLGTLMLWFLWKTWSELSPPRDQIEKLKKEGNAKLVQEAAAAVMKELKKAKHETGLTTSDEISLQTKTEQKGCDPKSGLCLKDGTAIPAKGLFAHGYAFYLDGKPFRILSGSFHYFRVQPASWQDRLLKMKAAGLNTVTTYIPWNLHETVKGSYQFTGDWDLASFILRVHQVGLKMIIRPGPYICAEWEFGGLPSWLLRDVDMKIRSSYKPYLNYVEKYFDHLLPVLWPWQHKIGKGPIIAFQIENEFGSYGSVTNELDYISHLLYLYKKHNINELLLTSDGTKHLKNGAIPGILETANFHFNVSENLKKLQAFQPNKPLLVGEYWDGWFDHWSETHHAYNTTELSRDLATMLKAGASINFYMFVGGTNWGFWNGANNEPHYAPTTTSYDYDAPISESGEVKPKYHVIRNLIKHFNLGPHDWLPISPNPLSVAYKPISMKETMTYLEMVNLIDSKFHTTHQDVKSMEMLDINSQSGQGYGWLLYRMKFISGKVLKIEGPVRDRAQIIVNGVVVKTFNWTETSISIHLENLYPRNQLDILVENLGRVNYKQGMDRERKGILGSVYIDEKKVQNWEHVPLEFSKSFCSDIRASKNFKVFYAHTIPAIYRGILSIQSAPVDTYLHMEKWSKGIVLVNGWNIGRYWNIGPQQTLYVPANLMRKGQNDLLVFDLHGGQPELTFSDKHIWKTLPA